MFDALFQALFSYRPVVFQQGEFRFDVSSASFVAALVAARRRRAGDLHLSPRHGDRRHAARHASILTTLRVAALGLVLFCLFRPTLVVRAAVNQRNVVAVVLDDSRSMQIPDVQGHAARPVRARPVRRARQPRPEAAGRAVPGAHVPLLVGGPPRGVGQGADVRRHPDQDRRLAGRRARGTARAAGGRHRAWCRTAPTRARPRCRTRCWASRPRSCRSSPSASAPRRCRATSRWTA